MFNESKKDSLELSHYSAMLASHLYWEIRDQYLKLLNEFMERKIDIPDFCIAFSRRISLNSEVVDTLESNLILLSPHEKSVEFADFIETISDYCDSYSGEPESLRESYELDDTEFQDSIEKTYRQLQNFLEK